MRRFFPTNFGTWSGKWVVTMSLWCRYISFFKKKRMTQNSVNMNWQWIHEVVVTRKSYVTEKNADFGHRCNCGYLWLLGRYSDVTSTICVIRDADSFTQFKNPLKSIWRLWNVWSFKYLIVVVDTFESWPINKTIRRSFFPHPPYPIDNARNRNPRVSFRPQIDILAACLRDLC